MVGRIEHPVDLFVLNRRSHDAVAPFKLASIFRRWRPDVVHCRNWATWLDCGLAHLFTGRRQTLVWSFHGTPDDADLPWRRRVTSQLLSHVTDHLLAVCEDSGGRIARDTGISRGRFSVIANGVDCKRFAPCRDRLTMRRELGLPTDAVVIVTVATLSPVKGHESLLHAARRLRLLTPMAIYWLFIGEGPLRKRLEREIQRLGLGDLVHLLGPTDRVAQFLTVSDIFVLGSRLEGMSNAILEAMAAGLPVVANAVGGNAELVKHEGTGVLCAPGDTDGLVHALLSLITDGDRRRALGARARERARRVFSLDIMISRYADFYRELGLARGRQTGI
jgi:glycosyltransferase involved in cell wall biosynthesis